MFGAIILNSMYVCVQGASYLAAFMQSHVACKSRKYFKKICAVTCTAVNFYDQLYYFVLNCQGVVVLC